MKEPDYDNKMDQPQTVIRHKDCKTIVIRRDGSRLWCEHCQTHVDASQCYHDQAVKADE
jgi:hypothetical protein